MPAVGDEGDEPDIERRLVDHSLAVSLAVSPGRSLPKEVLVDNPWFNGGNHKNSTLAGRLAMLLAARCAALQADGRIIMDSEAGMQVGRVSAIVLAVDLKTSRKLALKFVPSAPEFTREQALLRTVPWSCANRLYGAMQDPESELHMLVLERGKHTLAQFLEGEAPDEMELHLIATRAAQSLQECHEAGVIHADVSTSSFMQFQRNRWKLTDFDSSYTADDVYCRPKANVMYAPPELVRLFIGAQGQEPVRVAPSIDVWSFGLVLFEMFAGRPYFATPAAASSFAVKGGTIDVSVIADGACRAVVERCLRIDPSERPSITHLLAMPFFAVGGGAAAAAAATAAAKTRADGVDDAGAHRERVHVRFQSANGPVEWRKGQCIGQGSYGKVFVGLDVASGAHIAVKEIPMPGEATVMAEELASEIELLAQLDHKNIVRYYGTQADAKEGMVRIFLEYVAGGSLQAVLQRFGRFDEALARMYAQQAVAGLAYMHERGVVHRDIKCANLLVDDLGNVKLADFGAAIKLQGTTTVDFDAKGIKGTPYFMAPEAIRQDKPGRKSDIWSMGGTILQMVTGQPPWKERNFATGAAALFHIATSDSIPDWDRKAASPELTDLLLRCFQRNPDDRMTASEMAVHPWVLGTKLPPGGGVLDPFVMTSALTSVSPKSSSSSPQNAMNGSENAPSVVPIAGVRHPSQKELLRPPSFQQFAQSSATQSGLDSGVQAGGVQHTTEATSMFLSHVPSSVNNAVLSANAGTVGAGAGAATGAAALPGIVVISGTSIISSASAHTPIDRDRVNGVMSPGITQSTSSSDHVMSHSAKDNQQVLSLVRALAAGHVTSFEDDEEVDGVDMDDIESFTFNWGSIRK